jgi:hypothetical protein
MIKLKDDAMFVHPLPRRLARKIRRNNKRSDSHLIYRYKPEKRNDEKAEFYTDDGENALISLSFAIAEQSKV